MAGGGRGIRLPTNQLATPISSFVPHPTVQHSGSKTGPGFAEVVFPHSLLRCSGGTIPSLHHVVGGTYRDSGFTTTHTPIQVADH